MERHDYDLKQWEDDMINVLSEDVHARGYSVNIIFENIQQLEITVFLP